MSTSKIGRPTLSPGEGTTVVCVRLPDSLYDSVFAEASKERVSVPEVVRRALLRDFVIENSHSH